MKYKTEIIGPTRHPYKSNKYSSDETKEEKDSIYKRFSRRDNYQRRDYGRYNRRGNNNRYSNNYKSNSYNNDSYNDPYYNSIEGWERQLNEKKIFQNYSVGLNFNNYDNIDVKTYGSNVPAEINKFSEINFPKLLLENIIRAKYENPTPVQKYCVPIAGANRDIIVAAETGSGKTAGFLFPLISRLLKNGVYSKRGNRSPEALILSPTRELAQQIYKEGLKFCYKTPLKVSCVFGGIKVFVQNKYLPGTNILVATPGRVNDMINRGYLSMSNIQFFVLDEGDRMLDMGFLPQIEEIINSGMTKKRE